MQEAIIKTTTEYTSIGSLISIYTYYDDIKDELPNTIWVDIKDEVGSVEGVSFIEGEVLLKLKNDPEQIQYFIDENGEVCVEAPDALKYFIDMTDDELSYGDVGGANLDINLDFNI